MCVLYTILKTERMENSPVLTSGAIHLLVMWEKNVTFYYLWAGDSYIIKGGNLFAIKPKRSDFIADSKDKT